MRQVLVATLAVLSFGLSSAQSASAAWEDSVFGNQVNTSSASRSSARSERAERPARATRTARTETSAESPARQARSSGGSEGSSIGSGMASYYWQPQRVASGGWFNPNAMTAAHKTLPFGTRVRVTNERNGQSVEVTINDRGPYIAGRVIDLSSAAAGAINMKGAGVVPVRMAVLGR
jgi:rare lipoprotein A